MNFSVKLFNLKVFAIFLIAFSILFQISCKQTKIKSDVPGKAKPDSSSIEFISEKIRENPKNADLFFRRALVKISENETSSAIGDFTIAINLDSLKAEYYIKLGECQLSQGKSGLAKEAFDNCLEHFPDNTEVLIKLAKIHLYVKQYEESMRLLSAAQTIDSHLSDIFFTKAIIYKELNDTSRAIKNFELCIENEPEHYQAYENLAYIYAQLGDSLAVDYYKNAIEIIPENIFAHYGLAMFYQNQRQLEKAINEYEYIIENIDSANFSVYFNIGYINLEYFKNYDFAIEYFSKAISYKNNYIDAIYNRGLCYEYMKDYIKSKEDYNLVLQYYPNYENAVEALNRIDEILYKNK
ncbi:MAG: tetratricopeptide repeat protein [Bacteroidetes bacterium]|nr:tetratricopeptide repeat protein [Bacteroidota bacterium]